MKKIALTILFAAVVVLSATAQRYAYIDTEYILENIPEFQAAQQQINQLSRQWQAEIEAEFKEVEEMYRNYQTQSVLLPEDRRKQLEEQIVAREQKARELQMNRFGREGELFKKRQELLKPIQDQIYTAVEEIATRSNYAIIFDKASGGSIFYSDVRFDLSDEVLQRMGYRR